MPTVSDVCSFLDRFAPPELAEPWDNTGLLIGRRERVVHRVMTCLTLTQDVANEAVAEDVQIIVTHHPVLFRGTKQICDDTIEGRILLTLIEAGIAVFSPHTRFDSAAAGINQRLAEQFGLLGIRPLVPTIALSEVGAGRIGVLATPIALHELLQLISRTVRCDRLEYCGDSNRIVRTVAVACGAADGFLASAVTQGCDVFVTGESRFHAVLEAVACNVALVLTGHFSSERPAVEELAGILRSEFPGIHAAASQRDPDPLLPFQSPSQPERPST